MVRHAAGHIGVHRAVAGRGEDFPVRGGGLGLVGDEDVVLVLAEKPHAAFHRERRRAPGRVRRNGQRALASIEGLPEGALLRVRGVDGMGQRGQPNNEEESKHL